MNEETRPADVLALMADELPDAPRWRDLASLNWLVECLPVALHHKGDITPAIARDIALRAMLGDGKFAGSKPSRLPLYIVYPFGVQELGTEEREPLRREMQRYYFDKAIDGPREVNPPRHRPPERTEALVYCLNKAYLSFAGYTPEFGDYIEGKFKPDEVYVTRDEAMRAFFGIEPEQPPAVALAEPVVPSAVAVVPDSARVPASTPEPVAGTAGAGRPKGIAKSVLVNRHGARWPSIGSDLSDASTNGLAARAKAGKRGWIEVEALAWAEEQGRLLKAPEQDSLSAVMNSVGFTSRTNRLVG